jgi:hypothetical protein
MIRCSSSTRRVAARRGATLGIALLAFGAIAHAQNRTRQPDTSGVPAARNVNTTSPLSGGGNLGAGDLTLTCATCVVLSPGSQQSGFLNISGVLSASGVLLPPASTIGSGSQGATNTTALTIQPDVADGATSVALVINANTTLSNGTILSVQNHGSAKLVSSMAAATGFQAFSPGGSGRISADDSTGAQIAYGNNNCVFNNSGSGGITCSSAASSAVSTKNFQLQTQVTHSTAGDTGLAITTNSKYARYGVVTGVADVYCGGQDQIVKTGGTGTTVNRLVAASGNNTVDLPPATANLHTIVGIAAATVGSAGTVTVCTNGEGFVEYDGTAPVVGDVLVSSGTTAGRVIVNNAPSAGTQVGMAREAGGTTVANQVRILLKL